MLLQNALLQHRAYSLLSAGRSIAVQGFNENASVLMMLATYAALLALDVPIVALMWGFGLAIALALGLLMGREAWLGQTSLTEPQSTITRASESQGPLEASKH